MEPNVVEVWAANIAIHLWPKKVASFLENLLEWDFSNENGQQSIMQDTSDPIGSPIEVKCNSNNQ